MSINQKRDYTCSVHRVPEWLSHRRCWVPPHPLPRKRMCLPSWTPKGGEQHSLAVEEVGGPNADDWIEGLALCVIRLRKALLQIWRQKIRLDPDLAP